MIRTSRRWVSSLFRPRIQRPVTRLRLQNLESREVPAIFTVSNLADSGGGSLRQAILDANGTGGQDTINFQAGVTGTIPLASTLSITDSVVINGPGAGALSVSGQNTVRPFTISNSNPSVISVLIFDVTVTAGRSTGNNGGGVFTDNEAVRLDRVVVSNCSTTGSGGGVAVNTGGVLFLQDSTITGNTATGGTSNRGGGVYFFNGGALNMQGCTLVGNAATGTNGGGGLYFFGATSSAYGGVTVSNCTIAGNTAPIGGGIALRTLTTTANPVTIQNNTITGNVSTTTSTAAGYGGGGLSVVSGAGANIRVRSNIVSGNTATVANGRSDIATIPELLINNTAIGDTDGLNQAPGSGSNLLNQSLFLNTLASNGGLTQTISFAVNSPLRNAGSNLGGLLNDQRGSGYPRVIDGVTDIGAYEAPVITVTNLNDSGAGSLRQAILDSNASTSLSETIVFQSGLTGTINLGSQLPISDDVTITGPGASAIAISGQNAVRVFDMTDNNANTVIDVTVSGLTVTAGRDGPGTNNVKGGGIRVANERVTLDSVVVSNCAAVVPGFSEGGGIFVDLNGNLTVRNSTITGNSAVQNGGGIAVYGGGFGFVAGSNLLVENSTVSNNTTNEAGGGIFFIGDVGTGGVTVRNSTVANNTAHDGGGLRLRSLDTTLGGVLIQNSTFTGNRSTGTGTSQGEGGGGMQLSSLNPYAVTISSTIVSDNASANGRDDITMESGVTLNVTFSAIGDPDGFTINGTNSNNLPFGTPLGLSPLANNGGPTQTVTLQAGSPAINSGSNTALLTSDQRGSGFDRVNNGAPDIGAFEALVFTVKSLNDSGADTLRLALQVANLTPGVPEAIVFQAGLTGTINLATTLSITDGVSIAGPGASSLTISGQNTVRVFNIDNSNASVINVAIAGLSVTNGNAGGGFAGGLLIGNENVTLDRVVVANNKGVAGGGILVSSGGQLTVRNCTISGNDGFGGGGGIYFPFGGSMLLENSTVSNNKSAIKGGGVLFVGTVAPGGFTVRNSTITGNSASDGGGICLYNSFTPTAPVLIQNSTITGNNVTSTGSQAGRGGGGIAVLASNTDTINIVSTIVSGNSAANGRDDIAADATINVNFSAVGDQDGFSLSPTSKNNLAFGAVLGLGSLQDNDGPTQTIAFAANSLLLNAGSNPANLATDQRGPGFFRVAGTAADIGAFEAPSFLVSNVNDSGPGSLRQAILTANQSNGAETITFQAGLTGTIALGSSLSITDSATITGPGASAVTVSGGNSVRAFTISNASSSILAVTISRLTVAGGKATNANGGGIFTDNENVTLDSVVVRDSFATGAGNGAGSGAGVAVGTGGALTVVNSTVSGNSAANRGGGIYFYDGGSLFLLNSTISGNTAADANGGGGVYFFGSVTAAGVIIRNTTITNNTAPSGGGLALRSLNTATAAVLIQNNTITANAATTTSTTAGQGGGGIALTTADAATVTIVSTIVSGNTATAANGRGDIAIPNSATVNVNFSAIGDPDGFTRSGTSNNNLADGVALGLGSLANNGGPTQTHSLLSNSPAIGKGSNPAPALTLDQRGKARVVGNIDIGAFELQPAAKVSSVFIGDGTAQRSMITQLKVTFNSPIVFTGTPAAAFTLTRQGDSKAVNLAVVIDPTNTIATITFTGGAVDNKSLADGRYTFNVLANQIGADGLDGDGNGTGGDNFVLASAASPLPATNIFRLFGDVNGDGTVAAGDFIQFRLALGGNNPVFDFDGDGSVAASDFIQFRLRFGGSI